MYTNKDYPTKKKVKEALASGVKIRCYQPGPFGPDCPDGEHCFEGPHYPKPHRFYFTGVTESGILVKIKN